MPLYHINKHFYLWQRFFLLHSLSTVIEVFRSEQGERFSAMSRGTMMGLVGHGCAEKPLCTTERVQDRPLMI